MIFVAFLITTLLWTVAYYIVEKNIQSKTAVWFVFGVVLFTLTMATLGINQILLLLG